MYKKLLGAYRDKDLLLYRLHPGVKILLSFSFVLAAGLVKSFPAMGLLIAVFFIVSIAAGLKVSDMFLLIRPFRFLLVFTFVIQLFLTPMGEWVLPDRLTFLNALFFTVRMAVIIGFSALFAVITPVADIVRLFYFIFQPLRLIRINPADMAMSMLIALRFIPLLFTEGEKIVDSQRLKGVLPEKGAKISLRMRICSSVSLVVPLFVRTFHYADQISITLAYRRNDTVFFRLPKPVLLDILFGSLFIAAATGVVFASSLL